MNFFKPLLEEWKLRKAENAELRQAVAQELERIKAARAGQRKSIFRKIGAVNRIAEKRDNAADEKLLAAFETQKKQNLLAVRNGRRKNYSRSFFTLLGAALVVIFSVCVLAAGIGTVCQNRHPAASGGGRDQENTSAVMTKTQTRNLPESAAAYDRASEAEPNEPAAEGAESEPPALAVAETEPSASESELPVAAPEETEQSVPGTMQEQITQAQQTTQEQAEQKQTTQPETTQTHESADKPDAEVRMVWIPTNGGRKYHRTRGCSNMIDPTEVTLDEAKKEGFTPCKRCY